MYGLLVAILLSVVPVRVTTVDGKSNEGTLRSFNPAGIEFESQGKVNSISFEQLLSVDRTDSPTISTAPTKAELLGGSRVSIRKIVSEESTMNLTMNDQPALQVPFKQMRWVRFRPSSPTVDPPWLGIVNKPRAVDVLVVRRAGDAIDEVQGILVSISETQVKLNLDGDEVAAPIAKIEGVLFADGLQDIKAGSINLEDINGSRWQVFSIRSTEDQAVELDLGNGLKHQMPLSHVLKLETTGSVVFLANDKPATSQHTPFSKTGAPTELLNRWLGVSSQDGIDLVMHADSQVEYRVDGDYASLVGSAEIDPSVSSGGKCLMKIVMDDKVAWEQTFDVEKPLSLGYEIPIDSARRIRFEVSTAGDGDIGDTLLIRKPRLIK